MPELNLNTLRAVGMQMIFTLMLVLGALILVVALLLPTSGRIPAAICAVLVTIYPCAIMAQRRVDAQARLVMALSVVMMPVLLLVVTQGQVWQGDLHMLFFATLAVAAILCDWKAITAAAALVAVHHLVLGMLVPAWVFFGGDVLARILLHAVVLVVEAGALMWITQRVVALVDANEAQSTARLAAQAALDSERDAQAQQLAIVTTALGSSLESMTAGDLTHAIDVAFPPQYGALKDDFNAALVSLRDLIAAVSARAAGIRAGSNEISQASEDLARRTEGNAASLEQTSAALTQIDGRLRATVTSSSQTVARADQAIATVSGGRATAEEAVQAMGRVGDSAKGIDSVIEGMDKIAFQTRVLAMNAAVEAGRAGDAGRGFAVVADLVSALALRAEEEAKRARDQLTVTQAEIGTAVEAVKRVDGAFAQISGDVGAVHALLGSMSSDAQVQSSAITQITSAISSMDQATQQNAAMVEETSAAARNLTTEVNALAAQAASFRIGDTPPPVTRAATHTPPRATPRAAAAPRRALPVPATAGGGDGWSSF